MKKSNKGLAVIVIITGFIFTFFLVFLIPVNFGQLFKGNTLLNGIFIAIPILFALIFIFLLRKDKLAKDNTQESTVANLKV